MQIPSLLRRLLPSHATGTKLPEKKAEPPALTRPQEEPLRAGKAVRLRTAVVIERPNDYPPVAPQGPAHAMPARMLADSKATTTPDMPADHFPTIAHEPGEWRPEFAAEMVRRAFDQPGTTAPLLALVQWATQNGQVRQVTNLLVEEAENRSPSYGVPGWTAARELAWEVLRRSVADKGLDEGQRDQFLVGLMHLHERIQTSDTCNLLSSLLPKDLDLFTEKLQALSADLYFPGISLLTLCDELTYRTTGSPLPPMHLSRIWNSGPYTKWSRGGCEAILSRLALGRSQKERPSHIEAMQSVTQALGHRMTLENLTALLKNLQAVGAPEQDIGPLVAASLPREASFEVLSAAYKLAPCPPLAAALARSLDLPVASPVTHRNQIDQRSSIGNEDDAQARAQAWLRLADHVFLAKDVPPGTLRHGLLHPDEVRELIDALVREAPGQAASTVPRLLVLSQEATPLALVQHAVEAMGRARAEDPVPLPTGSADATEATLAVAEALNEARRYLAPPELEGKAAQSHSGQIRHTWAAEADAVAETLQRRFEAAYNRAVAAKATDAPGG